MDRGQQISGVLETAKAVENPTASLGSHLKNWVITKLGAKGFAWIAAITTFFTCITILSGSYVRASESGDGCGDSWPDCGGALVPNFATSPWHKLVEYMHRGLDGPLALLLITTVVLAYTLYPKKSAPRRAASYAILFTVTEIVVGAILVRFHWVTTDRSLGRAIMMPFHLVNTYILTANLTMLSYFGFTGKNVSWRNQGTTATSLKAMIVGMVLLGCSGAISALGKTAYALELETAKTFAQRWAAHMGENAPPILRGGAMHPFIATSIGVMVIWLCAVVSSSRPGQAVKASSRATILLYVAQFAFGIWSLLASAPAWMQVIHLGLAVGTWISVVVLSANALGAEHALADKLDGKEELRANRTVRQVVTALIAVTKPRVISLLLFTTLAAMLAAKHGWPDWRLILAVMVGGYFAAGASNAFNMIIETDLDKAMERTSHRPSVTGILSIKEIALFAWASAFGSFALLWASANLLTACMALCGLLTYVFVYTLWLKRITWQNIVIGGAAGAFPPLVGWASITNQLSPLAWFLFALIFTWTPVHFWALALLIKDDYAKANIPMLPVVKGDKVTVTQIMLYSVITTLLCIVPFAQRAVGPIFLVGSVLLNVGLMIFAYRLLRNPQKVEARALFKFSMAYLALIFIVVAVDKASGVS